MRYLILMFVLGFPYVGVACVSNTALLDRVVIVDHRGNGAASGVLYDEKYVLTAYHAVNDVERIWLRLPGRYNEPAVEGMLMNYDQEGDAALVKIMAPKVDGVEPLKIAGTVGRGEPIRLAGCAFGKADRCGIVAGKTISRAQLRPNGPVVANLLELEGPAFGGDSGSGIYTCGGELAGLEFGNMGHKGKLNMVAATRPERLRWLVKDLK